MEMREITGDEVAKCFSRAWLRAHYLPNSELCSLAAIRINSIVRPNKRTEGQTKELRNHIKRLDKLHNDYLMLAKSARAFLRVAQTVRDDLVNRETNAALYPEWNRDPLIYHNLNEALDAVVAPLTIISANCKPPKLWQQRDPIHWIAEIAKIVLKQSGASVPLGKTPSSPLVVFVGLVLQAINGAEKAPSVETISQHLRGEHSRQRSGKKKHPPSKRAAAT
jgi:hypothetical protein